MAKARMLGYQKTGATNAKAALPYWQVKRGSDCLCHGPRETFPGPGEQKRLRAVTGLWWMESLGRMTGAKEKAPRMIRGAVEEKRLRKLLAKGIL